MHVKGDEEKISLSPFWPHQFYAFYLDLALEKNRDNKTIKSQRLE
jgi:hypothetical protein